MSNTRNGKVAKARRKASADDRNRVYGGLTLKERLQRASRYGESREMKRLTRQALDVGGINEVPS